MFKTKNDLSEATRVKGVELLNARLAECVDLRTQTKQAHWNVKGPNFIALHDLFDKINEGLADGSLKPIIARTFPLEQIVEAHRYMESNQQFGKIVVSV